MAARKVKAKKKSFHLLKLGKPFIATAIILYFVFHALNGNHGFYALYKQEARATSNQIMLTALRKKRESLENKVSRMSHDSLDLDLLDEQARALLGYAKSGEIVYILPD